MKEVLIKHSQLKPNAEERYERAGLGRKGLSFYRFLISGRLIIKVKTNGTGSLISF